MAEAAAAEAPESTFNPNPETPQMLSAEQKFEILRSIGEECIQEDELLKLLAEKQEPIAYDCFEPSGRMTAQDVMKVTNVNKLTSAGCRVKIVIDDWFAQHNNKIGGDLKKIETVGRYFIESWKALGMDLDGGKVEFVWSSKEIRARPEYWHLVMDIARKTKLKRVIRCCQIMGRSEKDELADQMLYPIMQCADIFFLKADICQMGMDQQEVNVLAREYCDVIRRKNKPIILSHHMLPGLKQGQKMSKSDPKSSIFMDDEEADGNKNIKKAYCPPKIVKGNPCLAHVKYVVLPSLNEFTVERGEDNGGNKTFKNSEELDTDYESGELHPGDLKLALSKSVNKMRELVREHFRKDSNAKVLQEQFKEIMAETEATAAKAPDSLFVAESSSNPNPETPQILSAEQKFEIVRSIGEECIQEDELLNLLAKKPEPICYDGFEPSGRMHGAQGVMKVTNVNKLTSAGCRVKILIADWFAQLNNKMGGDLEKIETVGRCFIETWKAAGMDLDGGKVEFVWSSKEIDARADEYWPLVFHIAHSFNLSRIIRCCQIMGRSEKDELTVAQIFYPCMQCADVFFLKADICQLGMDQRKVNVLAREYCDVIKRKNKPIILSHHMLPGLLEGQEKMSKSNPKSAIFMEDEEVEVNDKIEGAYCPPKVVEGNPCIEYIKHIVLPWFNEFTVERGEDNGGNKTFKNIEELVAAYESEELHPADLKAALSTAWNKILEPVREHFRNDSNAKNLQKLVKAYRVTK